MAYPAVTPCNVLKAMICNDMIGVRLDAMAYHDILRRVVTCHDVIYYNVCPPVTTLYVVATAVRPTRHYYWFNGTQ